MSRHEGVSCDSCLKGNFRGRRYKCLICYDYDLCAACYEAGATTTRHTTEHPMQCILTRADFELYYGGEALTSVEQPQAYTCPYCNRMGFTDQTLQEHVTNEHSDISFEVVCPVCASVPGGDPNLMTDDFAGHLTLEHRSGPRDLISFLDEPVSTRHNVRRIPHTSRGVTGSRSRRSNMHFSEPYSTVSNPGPSHGIGGSGGDDDRNPYNRRPPYDSYSPRDKRKKKSKAKESKTEEEEENNPDVKIIWLYPLDKDGNLIFPEDEFVTSINNTVFEDRSNTFLNPEARRVYYSNPGTSSGDWGNTQDNWNTWGTWGSEWNPYGELATVNRYDRNELTLLSNRSSYGHDLLNSPENASTPRTGRVNSPPPPSISRFARPIRGRNIYGSAQITTASMNLVTSETTFSSAPISGSNTTGRYVIPQRRVHFESTHTTSAPINIPGVRNTEGMPAHLSPVGSPPRGESSYYADTYHRGSSRQAHQTLFYGDTDSSSNTSTETEMPPTYFNIPEGQSSNRGLATDAYFNPDMYTNYQEQEVWEPLPFTRPLESFDTSFSSTPVGSRLNESTDSSNVDAYWDIPAHQETSTSANRPSLPSDSNIQISRRQNQHDVDPRVDNDRLVIPLFRLDREGNLIYEDFNSSDEEEEDEVKSLSPTVKLFAPMEYKFDLEDSSDPSSTSSARSEEEKKDYTSKGCYSAFGIAYTTKNKSAGKTTVTRTTAGTTHYTTSHPLVASPGSTDITRSVDILLAPRASSISPETRNRIYNAQIASADRTSQALARDIDSYFHGSHRVADRNSSSPPNQNIFTIPEETMTVQQNARIEEIAQIIRNYNLSSPQTPMYSRSFEIDNVRIYTYTESPRNDNNDDDDDDDDTSSPEELAESLPDILDEVSFESLEIPCVENVEETPEELSLESTDNSSSDNMEEQSSKDTIHTNTPRNYKFRTHSQNVDIRQIQETEVSQEAENSVAGPSGLQSSDNQINQQANETIHYVNGIRLSNFAVPQGSTGIPGIIVNAPSFQEVMQESTDDNYTINGDNYPPQNVNLANDEDVDEVEIHGSWEDIDY